MGTALTGIRVVDLTRVRSGPMAVRQLADWGADVIRVEAPEAIDNTATMSMGRFTGDFQNTHRNKRSLTVNLKDPKGVAIVERLAERADVLVENFRPGVADRLGVGHERLSAINPRLVYASITGFGENGPYAGWPGFDQIVQGLGGLMSITGTSESGPTRVGLPIADLVAGLHAAIGILVALVERQHSNLGQRVTTSLLESQIAMLDLQAMRWLNDSDNPGLPGNMHPVQYATGTFRTRDGHINMACGGDVLWARLRRALDDDPRIADDPRFGDHPSRLQHRETVNAVLGEILCTRTTDAWMASFVDHDVPCGPILDIAGVFADPHVRELAMACEVTAGDGENKRLVGSPFRLSRSSGRAPSAAPERGADNADVLKELGYGPEEVAALRATGVV